MYPFGKARIGQDQSLDHVFPLRVIFANLKIMGYQFPVHPDQIQIKLNRLINVFWNIPTTLVSLFQNEK